MIKGNKHFYIEEGERMKKCELCGKEYHQNRCPGGKLDAHWAKLCKSCNSRKHDKIYNFILSLKGAL